MTDPGLDWGQTASGNFNTDISQVKLSLTTTIYCLAIYQLFSEEMPAKIFRKQYKNISEQYKNISVFRQAYIVTIQN